MINRIDEPFYPLTPETSQKLRRAKLTAAEWRLWVYLTEIDPWGDRYQDIPDTLTVMQEVGIKKSTYYTAIAKLQKLGLFDFQDKGFAIRNLAHPKNRKAFQETGNDSKNLESIPKNRKAFQKIGSDSKNLESIPKNRKRFQKIGNDSKKSENQRLEPSHSKGSNSSQIYSDYSDFNKTLSEGERENFLKFGLKKAAELPKLPTLPQKWIESNFDELYKQFCQANGKQTQVPEYDWSKHPQFQKALEQMRIGVPKFKRIGCPEIPELADLDKATRLAMLEFARKHDL
ncbi:MAG: hypothetical protein F6J89_26835, partial [Symploca sp. SIO1C4]|nr:hypothetical protein [Symploca sp. SIO1C4]